MCEGIQSSTELASRTPMPSTGPSARTLPASTGMPPHMMESGVRRLSQAVYDEKINGEASGDD
jgi:hypothetical protein